MGLPGDYNDIWFTSEARLNLARKVPVNIKNVGEGDLV